MKTLKFVVMLENLTINMLQIINIKKLETLPLFTGIQKVMDQENKFIIQFNKL